MKKTYTKVTKSDLKDLITLSHIIGEESLAEASNTDSVSSFPIKALEQLRSSKILIAATPSEYGGKSLGLVPGTNLALLTILKNIGKGNLVIGRVLEGHINAQILINQFGNDKQRKLFSHDARAGRLFGVWNTQAEDGTFLIKKDNDLYLNGSKTFATGTDFVSRPIVTAAKKDGSWQMCVVPLEKVAIKSDSSWWDPMGMRSSRSFKITFNQSHIAKINLLGLAGQYYQQPGFSAGSVRFAAVQLGAAERLFEETKKYLVHLHRTEDPFQKMRMGQMAIAVETGNQWLKAAAVRLDQYMKHQTAKEGEKLIIYGNMMRTSIEQICLDVMSLCQKCVGARGLNRPDHFERIIRDLSTYLRQPAPDTALTDIGNYIMHSPPQGSGI